MGSGVNIDCNFGMIVLGKPAIGNGDSVVEIMDTVSCNMMPDLAESSQ